MFVQTPKFIFTGAGGGRGRGPSTTRNPDRMGLDTANQDRIRNQGRRRQSRNRVRAQVAAGGIRPRPNRAA